MNLWICNLWICNLWIRTLWICRSHLRKAKASFLAWNGDSWREEPFCHWGDGDVRMTMEWPFRSVTPQSPEEIQSFSTKDTEIPNGASTPGSAKAVWDKEKMSHTISYLCTFIKIKPSWGWGFTRRALHCGDLLPWSKTYSQCGWELTLGIKVINLSRQSN